MTEQEKLREIVQEAWNDGGSNPHDRFGDFLSRAAQKITEAGYRQVSGKAPLLTDGEISRAAYERNYLFRETDTFNYTRKPDADKCIAQAQLDVANKHFGVKE